MISACATAPGPAPVPARPSDAEEAAFKQAEESLARGAEEAAVSQYTRYLEQFPRGRYAAAAWLRMGAIYHRQGSLDAAQAFYRSAIENFPHSAPAIQAKSALLDILIEEKHQSEAAELASQMLEESLDQRTRQSVLQRLTEMYRVSVPPSLSFWYAFLLYAQSPPAEKEQWEQQVRAALTRMSDADIEATWERLDNQVARSYLLYRYALILATRDEDARALELLTSFRDSLTGQPFAEEVSDLIHSLTAKLSFTPRTLGCLLPLSGAYEAYGRRVLNAVEMALSMRPGAENTEPFRLLVEDSGSDEATSVEGVRKLVRAGAGAILGPINTAPAAAQEAQRLSTPIVTFTQKSEVSGIGSYVFRNFLTPQSQVKALVDYCIHGLRLRKFAVLYPDEPYGKTFMTLFRDEVVRQGGVMVAVQSYAPGQTDFADSIKRLTGDKPAVEAYRPGVLVGAKPYYQSAPEDPERLESLLPDTVVRLSGLYFQNPGLDPGKGKRVLLDVDFEVLFIPDAPKTAGLILPQLAYHDIENIYLAGTNLWHASQLLDMARDYAQGAISVDAFDKENRSAVVRNFVDSYRSIYNTEPELMEAFAFDTANLLFAVLARPDLRLRSQVRDLLRQTVLEQGVTGPTAFGPDGEAIKQLKLFRIKGDRFIEIHP